MTNGSFHCDRHVVYMAGCDDCYVTWKSARSLDMLTDPMLRRVFDDYDQQEDHSYEP